MNYSIGALAVIACLMSSQMTMAQDTLAHKTKKAPPTTISLGPGGLKVYRYDSTEKNRKASERFDQPDSGFFSHFIIVDLGFNVMEDRTNYNSPAARNFLNVPDASKNSSLFNQRTGKSINVNIYPFMESLSLRNTKKQKINVSTGIGLQLYNFRYDQPITFTRNPNSVVLQSYGFKKDKLAFDFLNVPLMFTFKTRLKKSEFLVYGLGITAGYNLETWTKQESGEAGKVKVHDNFDFATFNSCLTGEIGFDDKIRFYWSYQLTNIYSTALNQHPISFGLRLFGM